MEPGKNGREFKVQGISFFKDQLEWAVSKHLNLSGLVRDLLDAYIAQESNHREETEEKAVAAVDA